MKIIFFLASLSQPRCIKRVKALYDLGFEVEVYGYTRGFYDVNFFPQEIKVVNLGALQSGKGYCSKLINNLIKLRKIINKSRSEKTLYYAFGYDLALICAIFSRKKFIYESSDLIYTYFNNFTLNICKYIDKFIIKMSYCTIFTSEGFANYLYKNNRPKNIIIQPNRVSSYFSKLDRKALISKLVQKQGLVFSYVGAFRYPETVFRFAKIIGEKYPQHKFYFYGDSQLTPLAKELANKYGNVKYFGKFKSPEDLEGIYSTIDVVIACYDARTINEQIAEPNKLYEAICFCKPIVATENTFLAKQVNKMQVGFSINPYSDEAICDFINNLTFDSIREISLRESHLNKDIYVDSVLEIFKVVKQYKQ